MNRRAYIFLVFIRGGRGNGFCCNIFWYEMVEVLFYHHFLSSPVKRAVSANPSIKTINMKLQKHDALQDDMTFPEAYFSKNIRKSTDP